MGEIDALFINPRTELAVKSKVFYREPPNGLLTLCAILENAGFDVNFLDCSIENPNELRSFLLEEPKIVGITSLTNTHSLALELFEKVKKFSPQSITLYGGPHATFKYKEILQNHDNIDYILSGEADQTIVQFMKTLFTSKKKDLSRIPNLAFRSDGKIQCMEVYSPANLDEIPFPARHLIDLQKYQVGTIIVNRGCPYNCAFCVRQKIFKEVRYRKVEDIIQEMQTLSRLGFRFVNLYDNLNISEEFALKLCREIQTNKIKLDWGCELRADKISLELAKELRNAGCNVVAVGVESGDPIVLKNANKVQNLDLVKKGVKYAKSVGLNVQAYFIIGLPGETSRSFTLTYNLLKELKLDPSIDKVNFFAATPYPGTALYEQPNKFGVQILHENWDLYDNNHLIMKIDSMDLTDLERVFEQAKNIEEEFSS